MNEASALLDDESAISTFATAQRDILALVLLPLVSRTTAEATAIRRRLDALL
jgi:hypothetical protein